MLHLTSPLSVVALAIIRAVVLLHGNIVREEEKEELYKAPPPEVARHYTLNPLLPSNSPLGGLLL